MKKFMGAFCGSILAVIFLLVMTAGINIPGLLVQNPPVTADRIATFDGTSGSYVQDSGFTIADVLGSTGSVAYIWINTHSNAVAYSIDILN